MNHRGTLNAPFLWSSASDNHVLVMKERSGRAHDARGVCRMTPHGVVWFAIAVLMCALSCAAPERSTLIQAVEATAAKLHSLDGSPGFGYAVIRDGRILRAAGVGYADVERSVPFTASTPFYVASTTKAFLGLAAAILAERGVWSLDAPVSEHLQLRLQPPLDASAITIRQLLTHTHGISNEGPVVTKLYTGDYTGDAELIDLLRQHPPEAPGNAFTYGNIGYNVAALVMAAATGMSWKEAVKIVLFEPLGMRGTTAYASTVDTVGMARPYRATPTGFERLPVTKRDATMHSAGGLYSTPSDMGRWLEAQIGEGRIDGRQVLSRAAVAESQRAVVELSQVRGAVRVTGYGLGWQIGMLGGDNIILHGGGAPGFATLVSFKPRRRTGVVVMANNTEVGVVFADLATRAFYDVLSTGRLIPERSLNAIKAQLDRARTRAVR